MGASAFGAIAGNFANSTVGTIAFGALSGGIGAELSGGNFWQGAVIGGIVAGLNHAMHAGDDNGYDREGRKVDNRGGDTIDYMYDDSGNIISSTPVQNSYSQFPSGGSIREYGHKWNPISPALKDPSFDIFTSFAGGGAVKNTISNLAKGKFIFEKFVYRAGGQSTFSIKWMNQSKSFMFRFERHNINKPNIGYRIHINLDKFKKGNSHIYLNPKYMKHSKFK